MTQQVLNAWVGESELYDIDCSDDLDAGETITSGAAPVSTPGGLTFGTPLVNVAPVSYKDKRTAPIGTVIQIRISGQLTGVQYVIKGTYITTKGGSPKAYRVVLQVRD